MNWVLMQKLINLVKLKTLLYITVIYWKGRLNTRDTSNHEFIQRCSRMSDIYNDTKAKVVEFDTDLKDKFTVEIATILRIRKHTAYLTAQSVEISKS